MSAITNREINSWQINDLLRTISSLRASLHTPEEINGDGEKLDGGAKMAMEASLIKACARLDTFLDDTKRWRFPDLDVHSQHYACLDIHRQIQLQGLKALQLQEQPAISELKSAEALRQQIVTVEETPEKPTRRRKKK